MSSGVSTSDVKSEDHKKLVEAYNQSIALFSQDMNSLSLDVGQNRTMLNSIGENLDNMSFILYELDSSLDSINRGIQYVGKQLVAIHNVIERQTAKMLWVLEQQNDNLKKIIFNLQRPLDIKAKELRLRAIFAFINGWYDESLADFIKSLDYNQYDFTIHHFLGHIYLFETQDREKALEHFELAVKYALPVSKKHASFSTLFVSLMFRMELEFEKAYTETKKAVKYAPYFLEAQFQHCINCVSTNRNEEAISIIEYLVYDKRADVDYIFNNDVLNKVKPDFINLVSGKIEILEHAKASKVDEIKQYNIKDKMKIEEIMNVINNSPYRENYRTQTNLFTLNKKIKKLDVK